MSGFRLVARNMLLSTVRPRGVVGVSVTAPSGGSLRSIRLGEVSTSGSHAARMSPAAGSAIWSVISLFLVVIIGFAQALRCRGPPRSGCYPFERPGSWSISMPVSSEWRVLDNGSRIHVTAKVDPAAVIGEGVQIGPAAVVGKGAAIGHGMFLAENVTVGDGARLEGPGVVQRDAKIDPGAVVGARAVVAAGTRVAAKPDRGHSSAVPPLHASEKKQQPLPKNRVARAFARAYRATHDALDRLVNPPSAARAAPAGPPSRAPQPGARAGGGAPAFEGSSPAPLVDVASRPARSGPPPQRPASTPARPSAPPARPSPYPAGNPSARGPAAPPPASAAASRRVHVPPAGISRGPAAPQRPNPVKAYQAARAAPGQSRASAGRTQ